MQLFLKKSKHRKRQSSEKNLYTFVLYAILLVGIFDLALSRKVKMTRKHSNRTHLLVQKIEKSHWKNYSRSLKGFGRSVDAREIPFLDYEDDGKKKEEEDDDDDEDDVVSIKVRKSGKKSHIKSIKVKTKSLKSCPEDHIPATKPYKPDDSTWNRIKTQNSYLTLTAHKIAIFGPEIIVGDLEDQEPRNSFKILNKTGELFKRFCPTSVIPENYIDNAIRIFMVLHRFMQPKRTGYLTDEETSWILKLLDKCYANAPSQFKLNYPCADNIIADGVTGSPICPPGKNKFSPTRFDVLLDIVFKLFELTHSNCFENFQGFSRVWHRYTMGIEDLFSLPMKQRWAVAGEGNNRFWKQILGPNFIVYNENIDKCVHFYAVNSPLHLRLPRFYQPYSIRYGAAFSNIFGSLV